MIQIWRKCTASVFEAFISLCCTPVPADIRCTSPGLMTEPVPMVSLCASAPVEHVADDLHVAVAVRREAAARGDAILVDHAQRAEAHRVGL